MAAPKWSVIDCNEVHSTRREWMDSEGRFRASVKLECHFEDRYKILQDLYTCRWGDSDPTAAVGNQTIGYLPRAYPNDSQDRTGGGPLAAPVMSHIGVDSVQFESYPEAYTTFGSDEQIVDYKSTIRLDVQYGRHWNIEESIEYDTEIVTQTSKDFQWASKANSKDFQLLGEVEVPVAVLHTAILTREFIGLSPESSLVPDFTTLIGCVNKINTEAYRSAQLNRVFKRGTLLMLEPEIRPSINMQIDPNSSSNSFGQWGWTVKVKFLYKEGMKTPPNSKIPTDEDTHNIFWHPRLDNNQKGKGAWDAILVKKETGVAQYPADQYRPFLYNQDINKHWLTAASKPLPASGTAP